MPTRQQLSLVTNEDYACLHISHWLSTSTADELLARSLELDWIHNDFTIYGKTGKLPRKEAIFGDGPYQYSYSNGRVVLTAQPWVEWLKNLRGQVEEATQFKFALVIGNRYEDGSDHIGWHDDGRPELGDRPAIASVSLGAARKFQVRPKPRFPGDETPISDFWLGHGDLLLMPPGHQETHRHRLPKSARVRDLRVNWTFRPWQSN